MKKYLFLLLFLCLSFTSTESIAYSLTVWAEGPGTVLIEYYNQSGEYIHHQVEGYLRIEDISQDDPIVLNAIPFQNDVFVRWDGNTNINGNPTILMLERNTSVVGVFDSYHCTSCGSYYSYNCYDYGDCDDYYYDDCYDCDHGDDDCCFIQSLK